MADLARARGMCDPKLSLLFSSTLPSWFKKDFFKWTNKPACSGCGKRGGCMQGKGMCPPTPEDSSFGASRVELYACKECGAETRFPRYNDPAKLLETRNVSAALSLAENHSGLSG